MRYTHTNINSPDWQRLSAFYQKVFGCAPVPPQRDLSGEFFEKVTGVPGAHVQGEHLRLPGWGPDGPTIEIFTYAQPGRRGSAAISDGGFAHIAFEVDDVAAIFARLLEEGGSACGELVTTYYPTRQLWLTLVYAKDPDGNVVEIQRWHAQRDG